MDFKNYENHSKMSMSMPILLTILYPKIGQNISIFLFKNIDFCMKNVNKKLILL